MDLEQTQLMPVGWNWITYTHLLLTFNYCFIGAQSFQSQGPLGGFGASAANSQTQGFHAGPQGISVNKIMKLH